MPENQFITLVILGAFNAALLLAILVWLFLQDEKTEHFINRAEDMLIDHNKQLQIDNRVERIFTSPPAWKLPFNVRDHAPSVPVFGD